MPACGRADDERVVRPRHWRPTTPHSTPLAAVAGAERRPTPTQPHGHAHGPQPTPSLLLRAGQAPRTPTVAVSGAPTLRFFNDGIELVEVRKRTRLRSVAMPVNGLHPIDDPRFLPFFAASMSRFRAERARGQTPSAPSTYDQMLYTHGELVPRQEESTVTQTLWRPVRPVARQGVARVSDAQSVASAVFHRDRESALRALANRDRPARAQRAQNRELMFKR